MANFAVIGVGGFVAPRHLEAIRATGNRTVAATDPADSVGVLDRFGYDIRFFREIERFDRHLDKLRRTGRGDQVDFVSICSPNYLHDSHVRLALRSGADAICEKPLVINPWNLDGLEALERETGRRVFTVLQLRVHPALLALKQRLASVPGQRHRVELSYVTSRGSWYDVSWKGSFQHSGGVATNIGIHFFDLLVWLFGQVERNNVYMRDGRRCSGFLQLESADVAWFLSVNNQDLRWRDGSPHGNRPTYRSIKIDDQEVEFSDGFADLHTRLYQQTLSGEGFRIAEARPSIELVYNINHHQVSTDMEVVHPWLPRILAEQ